jgi:TolB-like protein
VVLPFTNLSGDPSQDYFADGITENLTTDLSRIRNSFVIARNTAFTFKGKNIPVKEISKELGVRYVLEGSVQRDQNQVRVNAQLIDGTTGAHLLADRFEEDMADVFKLQDQVVARLANVQAARVILLRPASWSKHGFGVWLARAAQRLHRNVLAAALANKLARIAWTVLAQERRNPFPAQSLAASSLVRRNRRAKCS